MFGYHARHSYENNDLDEALKYTKQAIITLAKFDDVETRALLLSTDHRWARERFTFMQKVLRDIVVSADPKINQMQKSEASYLLTKVDEINDRLQALATAQARQVQQEAEKSQRKHELRKMISDFNSDDPKKSVSLSYKEKVAEKYLGILSNATSEVELEALKKIIKDEDKVLDSSATLMGISLGIMKNAAFGVKGSFYKNVDMLRDKLQKQEQGEANADNLSNPPTTIDHKNKGPTKAK